MRCFAHRAAALLLHHPAQSWDPLSTLARHPVDLLHVDWPARDENDIGREWSRSLVQLDLTPKAAGGKDILDSGTCQGSVEVRARNADAVRTSSPDYWDSEWSGKPGMWDHPRVAPREKIR
jgi:hypothetical protein